MSGRTVAESRAPSAKAAKPNPSLEREGVAAVMLAVSRDLGWIPREQPISDFGIDMLVETVERGRPTGRLLALQIKSGPSYFRRTTAEGIVFRDASHLEYWSAFALPVLVVLYDPGSRLCYWQVIQSSSVTLAAGSWSTIVPWDQRLDGESAAALAELAAGDPYLNALATLRADVDLLRAIEDGGRVMIELDEWINKSSGRGQVRVLVEPEDGHSTEVRAWDFLAPGWAYEELIPALFPWATLVLDDETYDEHDRNQWDLETGAWDNEDGRYITHSVDYEDWASTYFGRGLRPYSDNGEVASWRLEARIGDVGRAFLRLDDYLSQAGALGPR